MYMKKPDIAVYQAFLLIYISVSVTYRIYKMGLFLHSLQVQIPGL
jgi:hypothetical protein